MNRKKGFTLIELCVVLALLGMMGALGVASFGGLRVSGADHVAEQNLQVLQSAYQLTKSIAISTQKLSPDSYEVTVHKDSHNVHEAYFNEKMDAMLSPELLGHYDVADKSLDGASHYIIHYYMGKDTYVLENGQFSKLEEVKPPPDPIEQVKQETTKISKDMTDLSDLLKDKTDQERRAYFEEHGLTGFGNNLTNDTYRRFLYEVVYGGQWPEMTQEFKDEYGLKQEHLYIQPYVYDVKKPDDVIVFARTDGTVAAGWFVGLIYYEGQWYSGKSFSITGSKANIKATMDAKGWKPLEPVPAV